MCAASSIVVVCPRCQKTGLVQIPTEIIQDSKGLSTVLIRSGVTCEHAYQVFLDKNFKVRGYQRTDYEVLIGPPTKTTPQSAPAQNVRENPKRTAPDAQVIATLRDFQGKIDGFVAANICAHGILELYTSIQSRLGFHPVLPDMKNWINQLSIGAIWDTKMKDLVRKRVAFWIEKSS